MPELIKAGVDVEVFMSNEGYPDEITYSLVAAASEVLRTPAEQILAWLGEAAGPLSGQELARRLDPHFERAGLKPLKLGF